MSDSATTQTRYDKWSVAECPFVIEYRRGLMQELRAAVAYGQQALTRGGMEVGGVLLGTRSNGTLTIRAWRPIACEHASGPAMVLSERDRSELKKFLAEATTLPDLAGLEPVGWFLSHTRSDISLRDTDLNLYHEFFPAATDVALVLRPGRHGAARAGFFFRGPGGLVHSEQSLLEFNIEGESAWTSTPAEKPPAPRAEETGPVDTAAAWVQSNREEEELEPDEPTEAPPVEELEPELTGRRSWRWIALPAAALVAIAWLYLARPHPAEPPELPIPMTVTDRAGQLVVEWDHARPELQSVRWGEISVIDGSTRATVPLTAAQAQSGSFTWVRKTGDVQVLLNMEGAAKPLTSSARFLGQPPHPPQEAAAQTGTAELDRLRKENTSLRGEVERAKAQASQAETVIRVLRARVDAAESKK